eukprot:gene3389-5934_t
MTEEEKSQHDSSENKTETEEPKEVIQDYFGTEPEQINSKEEIKKNMNTFETVQDENLNLQELEKKAILELTTGFENTYIPTLEIIKTQLELISKSQKELISNTQGVNNEFSNIPNFQEISQILDQLPMYIQKTKQVSKKMKSIDEKVHVLKVKTEKSKGNLKK